MCGSPLRIEGLVDLYLSVGILSESLLEMLGSSIEAFTVTDDLGPSDKCRKNCTFSDEC
jgi:hypothetical protein